MKYITLLRGINVGGNKKVHMKKLKIIFESLKFTNVSTYINSGNIIFESPKKQNEVELIINEKLKKEFDFEIKTLVKTENEIKNITKVIPKEWKNDSEQKTDIAYLFKEIDSKKTIDLLPIKKEYINIKYVPGAIIWNIKRKDYNKSQINKIISNKMYKFMTIRNINTSRYLSNL